MKNNYKRSKIVFEESMGEGDSSLNCVVLPCNIHLFRAELFLTQHQYFGHLCFLFAHKTLSVSL